MCHVHDFIPFMGSWGVFASQLSLGEGSVHPGQVASSSQGPSLMAEAAMQGAICTSGAIWGSVAYSRTL